MLASYYHNHNRLDKIVRHMRRTAEAMTLADRPKERQYGRNKATWTGADERYYLDRFFELEAKQQKEIKALKGKLTRQKAAIECLTAKLRINDVQPLRESPVVHPGFDQRTNYPV